MKQKLLFSAILVLLTLITSCRKGVDFEYYTRINPDGSIYKKISALGDSASIYENPFSFNVNDWKANYSKKVSDNKRDTTFIVTVEKTFPSVDQLNSNIHITMDSTFKDNIVVDHQKSFRWFYTFHHYSETYLQRFPYRHVSINDYLAEQERLYLLYEDTACVQGLSKAERDDLEELAEGKFWKFIYRSCGCEYVSVLNKYAQQFNHQLISEDDSISILQVFDSHIGDDLDLNKLGEDISSEFNIHLGIMANNQGYLDEFERQMDDDVLLLDDCAYTSMIEFTGLLYDTNANSVDDQLASWQFRRSMFVYHDFDLYIKYRTTNYWAFVITILFIICIIGFVVKLK